MIRLGIIFVLGLLVLFGVEVGSVQFLFLAAWKPWVYVGLGITAGLLLISIIVTIVKIGRK